MKAPKAKVVAIVNQFRYLNKKGLSVTNKVDPIFKRRARVRVLKEWGNGKETSLYKGEALDPSLIQFLRRNADPRNQEIYFSPRGIFIEPREENVPPPPQRAYVGRYGAQAAYLD